MAIPSDVWRAAGLTVIGLVVGGSMLVWPNYREARQINMRLSLLQDRVSKLDDRTREVERLGKEVSEVAARINSGLRSIPEKSDVADLVRRLSLPIDGLTVRDQTFAASTPVKAVPGSDYATQSMPLKIELDASFDSIFALVQAAESMDRLIRVASLRLSSEDAEDVAGSPFLTASIGVEAIYEPVIPIEEP